MDYNKRLIAPSILAGDFGNLCDEAKMVEAAGADWLHLDVMDGHFVDNISFGPAVVAAIHRSTRLPLDVHLMIARPDHFYSRFVEAGARNIHVHIEADHDVAGTLRNIRVAGCGAGLVLNPPTPFEAVEPYLDQIDILLVMTVNPGFGGQAFLPEAMDKVKAAVKARTQGRGDYHVEVDGGIRPGTAKIAVEAGANILVGGTYVFNAQDVAAAIESLRNGD